MALRVGQAALPAYRSTFSKRRFQPPHLIAIFCLMRDEDGRFREAGVRLAEHAELRRALGLPRVPDDPTRYRSRRRLNEAALEDTLSAVVPRLGPQPGRHATVAVDATGLAPGAISPFVVTRANDRGEGFTWRHRLQWTMVAAIDRRVTLAQTARRGPTHDGATLHPLVSAAHERVPSGVVLADAACDRARHHQHSRQTLRAQRTMPAKRGGAQWRVQGVRAQMRRECPAHLYGRRSLIERLISSVTRQRSARAPGRSLQTPCLQALWLGIADTIARLWRCAWPHMLRMSTEPDGL